MLQKFKDLFLCVCLGFMSLFIIVASMLGGENIGIIPLILIVLVACGVYYLKSLNYFHFINLIAFLFPIAYVLNDMKLGIFTFIAGVGAFLLGGGLRFVFTAVSFYNSAKKKS